MGGRALKSKSLLGNLLLLLAAAIWGCAFVAQSMGNESGPLTFNGTRMFLGGIVLVPFVVFGILYQKKKGLYIKPTKDEIKTLFIAGISSGVLLFLATTVQQIGLMYTSPGKSGFITAMYVVFVPILGCFLKKKPSSLIWVSVILAVSGLFLLCVDLSSGFSLAAGDFITLPCALLFSFQIMVVDHFSVKVNGIQFSCLQFFTAGIIGLFAAFIFENPIAQPAYITGLFKPAVLGAILYSGILSCGAGYTLQIIGQKYTKPAIASILMSFESVFAVIGEFIAAAIGLISVEKPLGAKELIGCALMFSAILIAQIPKKQKSKA